MAKYTVYGLVDPTVDEVKYVGISKHVYRRYYEHLHKIDFRTPKGAWIANLLEQGRMPGLVILHEEDNETDARERERYWIKLMGTRLTNWNHNVENHDSGTRIDNPELEVVILAELDGEWQ